MKMKYQEYIRTMELLGGIIAIGACQKFANIDVSSIALLPFLVDTLISQRTATLTKDYKEIKYMYDEVINNFSKFMKDIDKNDVIEIFAIYIYMYRKGYLSSGHYFEYNTKMKDLPRLMGVDVIRGSGVCRSVASMLSDIYNKMSITSDTLIVNTTKDTIQSLKKLSPASLNKSIKGKKFAKIIGNLTKYGFVANHLITAVKKDGRIYILDPTNDGILYKRGKNTFYPYDDNINMMKYNIVFSKYQQLIGLFSKDRLKKDLDNESINQQEYYDIYISTINFINNNIDYFEQFYHDNFYLYNDIYKASDCVHSYIKRIVPTIYK